MATSTKDPGLRMRDMAKARLLRREQATSTWADLKMENDGAEVPPIGKWPMRRGTCAKFATQRRLMHSSTIAAMFVLALNAPSRSKLVLFVERPFDMWLGCTGLKTEFVVADWIWLCRCTFCWA